jgi:hypothetical protein
MRTLAVLAVVLSVPSGALGDDARRCTRAKARAAEAYVVAYHDCYANAAAGGGAPTAECLEAAKLAARARMDDADARGPCPGIPNLVVNAICPPALPTGAPACRAAKYRALGWRLARRLACQNTATVRGTAPRPACFARVDKRFARRMARADALGACGGDAEQLAGEIDRCAVRMANELSCGNGRLDYGEVCEATSAFCSGCQVDERQCCATAAGCFQFGGPIEACFFDGGLDVVQGFCGAGGCVEDVPISPMPLCCERRDAGCSADVAHTAEELRGLVADCVGGITVVGTCGAADRCVPASEAPVTLPTTTTTTTSTTTTTADPIPTCFVGGACGSCGDGTCVEALPGIPIGVCVRPGPGGPCAPTAPACGSGEVCVSASNECRATCF